MKACILAVLAALSGQSANAEGSGPRYDEAELIRAQAHYSQAVLDNFYKIILPQLDPADAAALADTRFEFPLTVPEADPMAFSSTDAVVTMSVQSLLFLHDLATADSWLSVHDYAPFSVMDYAAMLKYRRLGENPPQPLQALCIPATALDDPEVERSASIAFDTVAIFILLHELGHVLYHHPGYTGVDPAVARANEAAADKFALDGLARVKASPLPLINYFAILSAMAVSAGDFATQEEFEAYLAGRTHPIDAARIEALVGYLLDDPVTAGLPGPVMAQIVVPLKEKGLQQILAARGMYGTEANLAPMRFGEMLGTPCGYVADGQDFSGPYDGVMVIQGKKFLVSLILSRHGASVQGAMSFGFATNQIEGALTGSELGFRWYVEDVSGRGVLRLGADGALGGTWGNGASATDGGALTVSRREAP